MKLKQNERVDDLQLNNLKIIQNSKDFCFGIDSVLLSDFAKGAKKHKRVVDLCTGNGVIAILLSAKLAKAKEIIGVEIQEYSAELANRSIELNNLQNKIQIINKDLLKIKKDIQSGSVDLVVCNPPYKPKGSGIINEKDSKTIARHEISCTLDDIIKEASRELNFGGSFCMVHKVERMTDIFCSLRKHGLEPKRMRLIYPKVGEAANLVLIEGIKGGKPFLNMESPIYVYKDENEYTDQIYDIYGMSNK
ncbi:MAG: tRNA1(Val) (adenine(37)-N6)-methyltransferase [Clostridia bacterium]|nr:tRNA1(Val) (adenine(37)-N6)-methyltransferase [Clostridia bacterium]